MSESQHKASEALPVETRSKQDYATSDIRNHYIELDALRGIAILGVFTLHATQPWANSIKEPLNVPILNIDLLKIGQNGGLGVVLFFLLSGYLLTWTEERRARDGNYSLRSYALRRAFRLLPAYYVALLVVGFLVWPAGKTFVDIVSHLTLMQSFVPHLPRIVFDPAFWSLTPEVVFYILLPFLILKMRSFYSRLALMLVLLAVGSAIEAYLSLYTSEGEWLFYYLGTHPITYLWVFIAGVLLRMMVERMQGEGRSFRFQPHLATLMFAASVVLLLVMTYYPGLMASFVSFVTVAKHILVVMFFAAALLGSPWLLAILRWKVLAFIGTISYSLFLLHNSVLHITRVYGLPEIKPWFRPWLAQQGDLGVWAAFTVYFGGTLLLGLALSYLSYRYIESPFLRRKPKG